MENLYVVVDTNTFLHYVSLDQIGWGEIFPDHKAVLVICPPVIRELNKHKDSPRTPKLRDRAASALRKINEWSDLSSTAILRDSAEVHFRIYDSRVNFSDFNLVREIADDHLIATLIELKSDMPSNQVVLLTKDTGLKLKAKAAGFSSASLPDSALLPEEVLPSEKRIRDLENEVRELQNARPRLRLGFADGSSNLNLRFQGSKDLSESDIASRLLDIKTKFPLMVPSTKVTNGTGPLSGLDKLLLDAGSEWTKISTERITEYNKKLEEFFTKYDQYLKELADYYAWERRAAALEITLFNEGTCPADDIDVFMHFPDGFELFSQDEYLDPPQKPKAPQKPRSLLEEIGNASPLGLSDLSRLYTSPNTGSFRHIAAPSNVSGPKIKRTNSYDVKVSVKKAKHGIKVPLDVMYLSFDPFQTVQSFTIDYEIHASNLPKHVTGTLDVIARG